MDGEYFLLSVRLLVGTVFLVSGVGKLLDRRKFVMAAMSYDIVPDPAAALLGRLLPILEASAAVALLLGVFVRATAGVLAGVVVVLTAAVLVNVLRGRDMDCGCFGELWSERIGWNVVARNAALFALLAVVTVADSGYLAIGRTAPDGLRGASDIVPLILTAYSITVVGFLGAVAYGQRRALLAGKPDLVELLPADASASNDAVAGVLGAS